MITKLEVELQTKNIKCRPGEVGSKTFFPHQEFLFLMLWLPHAVFQEKPLGNEFLLQFLSLLRDFLIIIQCDKKTFQMRSQDSCNSLRLLIAL